MMIKTELKSPHRHSYINICKMILKSTHIHTQNTQNKNNKPDQSDFFCYYFVKVIKNEFKFMVCLNISVM